MAAEFEILLQDPIGQPLKSLDAVVECVYARGENITGEMTLILPDLYYPPSFFKPYSRIIIQRGFPGRPPKIDLDTPWFIVNGPFFDLSKTGERIVVIECMDALGFVLSSANIAYQQYSDQAYKQGYADDLAKAFVRENMGSLATDTSRDLTGWLEVENDASLAAFLSGMSFERMQVLDAIQKVAQASAENALTPLWMGFDVVQPNANDPTLLFKTYAGQRGNDHRRVGGISPLVLSAEGGGLSNVRSGNSFRDIASFVYAGGASVGDLKPVATAQDVYLVGLGPFARRERYIDTQAPDGPALQAEAYAGLRRMRPFRYMVADIVEVVGAVRGIDWDYGDYLTAEAHNTGESYDVRVSGIGVKLRPGRDGGLIEEPTVSLRGESFAIR